MPLRPLRVSTAVTIALMALTCLAQAFLLLLEWELEGVTYDETVLTVWNRVLLVWTLLLLITGVAFIRWLFDARYNTFQINPVRHRRHDAWVLFGWLVPVVNLVFPKQIMDDVWTTSRPGAQSLVDAPRSGLVWAWWLTYVGATLVPIVLGPAFGDDRQWPEVTGLVLHVVAGVLAARILLRVSALHREAQPL